MTSLKTLEDSDGHDGLAVRLCEQYESDFDQLSPGTFLGNLGE